MTYAEFKKWLGLEKGANLRYYHSKSSKRLVAGHGNIIIVTTEDFDINADKFVYPNPMAEEGVGFVVSNTAPAEPVAEF